jgi:hypothetical protein
MTDLFSFEWDTMFVFHPNSDYRPIYNEYQDIARRIVFVKGSKIMYMEDEIAIEVPYSFYILSKDIFYKYGTERRTMSDTFITPETAVFSVQWKTRKTYYLTQVSDTLLHYLNLHDNAKHKKHGSYDLIPFWNNREEIIKKQ